MKLLLSILLLGCAGVCCGQQVKPDYEHLHRVLHMRNLRADDVIFLADQMNRGIEKMTSEGAAAFNLRLWEIELDAVYPAYWPASHAFHQNITPVTGDCGIYDGKRWNVMPCPSDQQILDYDQQSLLNLKTKTTKPEAMDVPAIQENYIAHKAGEMAEQCMTSAYCTYDKDVIEKRWTCSDKSRILLTAEDKTRHCIKFPK
jgi:hypothetical protein